MKTTTNAHFRGVTPRVALPLLFALSPALLAQTDPPDEPLLNTPEPPVASAPAPGDYPVPAASPGEAARPKKAYDLLSSPVAYSVPTMEDIILASQFTVPSADYLNKGQTLLNEVVLSLDVLNTDGEFRVVLHRSAKDNPAEVGDEVAEIFRGTPRSLALEAGNQRQVRFDQRRGLRLPDSDYFVVLHGLSGISAVAWNVTERVNATSDTLPPGSNQVIWNPEVHRRLMRKGQLATAMLPDDAPEAAGPGNLGGLPLALSAGGAFMMQVTVSHISAQGVVPEPASAAALLGLAVAGAALRLRPTRSEARPV